MAIPNFINYGITFVMHDVVGVVVVQFLEPCDHHWIQPGILRVRIGPPERYYNYKAAGATASGHQPQRRSFSAGASATGIA